jgi:hypothetical protein
MQDLMNGTHTAELPGVKFDRTGINFPDGLPYEKWEVLITELMALEGAHRWWLGDAINYGEHTYGDKYAQAIDLTGISYEVLKNYCYVARNVQMSLRSDNLSWTHHYAVAHLDPAMQKRLLQLAEDNLWTTREMQQQVRERTSPQIDTPRASQRAVEATEAPDWDKYTATPQNAAYEATATAYDDSMPAFSVHQNIEYFSRSEPFAGAAYDALGDFMLYGNLDELRSHPPCGAVLVDVPEGEQIAAFGLLRAAFRREEVLYYIFVSTLPAGDPAMRQAWDSGAACLMDGLTVYYDGWEDASDDFAQAFQNYGPIVVPWKLPLAQNSSA